jgi:hypothetical protein
VDADSTISAAHFPVVEIFRTGARVIAGCDKSSLKNFSSAPIN